MIFLGSFLIGKKNLTATPYKSSFRGMLGDGEVRMFAGHVSRSDLLKINGSYFPLPTQHHVNAYS